MNTTLKHLEVTMSKLYTEEQVMKAIKLAQKCESDCGGVYFYYENAPEIIDDLTPIELPSDEEIWKEYSSKGENLGSNFAFARGAEWMRDKIKGEQ